MTLPVHRVPGTAVFLNSKIDTTLWRSEPTSSTTTRCMSVVILSLETLKVPHLPDGERVVIDDLGFTDDGISHVTARYGFQDDHDVPDALALCALEGPPRVGGRRRGRLLLSLVTPTRAPGMRRWRKRLFALVARNSANPVEYFSLPLDRTLVVGARIEF